jgi:hypothetical protein
MYILLLPFEIYIYIIFKARARTKKTNENQTHPRATAADAVPKQNQMPSVV